MLRRHEGERSRPYEDSEGFITIGIGRNLDAKGLSKAEIEFLFNNDLAEAEADLSTCDWVGGHGPVRYAVLVNMCFNLGLGGLNEFKRMIAALRARDYARASDEMLDSKWAQQVGYRASELAAMMESGEWL